MVIPLIKKRIQEAIWEGAGTVRQKTNLAFCHCDLCHCFVLACFCKIFHTINKQKLFPKPIKNIYLLTDHIYVCSSCKVIPNLKWIGCNCKKTLKISEEELCQVQ